MIHVSTVGPWKERAKKFGTPLVDLILVEEGGDLSKMDGWVLRGGKSTKGFWF